MVSIVFVLVAIEDTIFATIENIATVDDSFQKCQAVRRKWENELREVADMASAASKFSLAVKSFFILCSRKPIIILSTGPFI